MLREVAVANNESVTLSRTTVPGEFCMHEPAWASKLPEPGGKPPVVFRNGLRDAAEQAKRTVPISIISRHRLEVEYTSCHCRVEGQCALSVYHPDR